MKKGKKYGPNVARGWIGAVLHPLVRALDGELNTLDRKNWTWRFQPPRLEEIAPMKDHLPSYDARVSLDQFLAIFPELKDKADRHDRDAIALFDCCRVLHLTLTKSEELRDIVLKIAEESPNILGSEIDAHFGAYSDRDDYIAVLAEHLVNGSGELPGYYAVQRLWNHYRLTLQAVWQSPEIARRKEELSSAGDKLRGAAVDLRKEFDGKRSELSLECDVPLAGPVEAR
jgi:hypothetical protein